MKSLRSFSNTFNSATDRLAIAIRAYVPDPLRPQPEGGRRKASALGPSRWTLVFDIETTTDPSQRPRFGCYQVRDGAALHEAGVFFDADALGAAEQALLQRYAQQYGLRCLPIAQFVDDIFYGIGYELRAAIVGFNLPFDLSRLAMRHGRARGKAMRGGFTFQLSQDPWKPRIQIKHLSARSALIQFAGIKKRNDNRRMRREGRRQPVRRGAFIDLKTIAVALTSRSFSLATLADFLKTSAKKAKTDDHGVALTGEYVDYAVQDVQVTWECYRALCLRFDEHGLSLTRLGQIKSEAGLGKAYLKEMGVRPLLDVQPDVPDWLTGIIMSTYYGGRAEVHLRRIASQVLYCDFLSMYPTVCILMRLWRFVTAKGFTWHDATASTVDLIERVTLADLQQPATWQQLTTLVQIRPDSDIVPVRAHYEDEAQATIGTNGLGIHQPLWFTLADCIAAKLRHGKSPTVVQALSFSPGPPQDGLNPIRIGGPDGEPFDPVSDDFYRWLINSRNAIKARLKMASPAERAQLESAQLALKILANATSYGIFVELNVERLDAAEERLCYGPSGKAFPVKVKKIETPGRYFHPLIATLITGAARLMLTPAELLAIDAGLDWALCDTDSLAIAKPDAMDPDAFLARAATVADWFVHLNPYQAKGSLLKVEDVNMAVGGGGLEPLYCLAISAKRYVLFNIDGNNGLPVIRKASGHGLGHLLAPYAEHEAPRTIPDPSADLAQIGVERWQYDLWYQIIRATLAGHPDRVDLNYHPALDQPAMSRYAATTPDYLAWFDIYNEGRPYAEQVRPFNFLAAFQALPYATEAPLALPDGQSKRRRTKSKPLPKPIAPYHKDTSSAAKHCFDRQHHEHVPVPVNALKTYRQAIAQHHLSSESKFLNGCFTDVGPTVRRHVEGIAVRHIGKEANRWEEQFFLGFDADEQIDYGSDPDAGMAILAELREAVGRFGQRTVAARLGCSRTALVNLLDGRPTLSGSAAIRIAATIEALGAEEAARAEQWARLLDLVKGEIEKIGVAEFSRRSGIDASNLAKVIQGKRGMNKSMGKVLQRFFPR